LLEQDRVHAEYKRYTEVKPFSFSNTVLRKHHETPPLFYMDVEISSERAARLAGYEGTNPQALSREFAAIHNLDYAHTKVLEELIRTQLQQLHVLHS